MTELATDGSLREIPTYRQMAESCRKMAAASRRPDALLLRAQTFEAMAVALEKGEQTR